MKTIYLPMRGTYAVTPKQQQIWGSMYPGVNLPEFFDALALRLSLMPIDERPKTATRFVKFILIELEKASA